MTAVLPDLDELVRKALDAALTAQVFNLWPDDWYERRPLVVARRVPGGGGIDRRFADAAIVDVQACAATRATASLLARQAEAALWDACIAQFSDAGAGGYLSRLDFFTSGGPAELRANTATLHPDAFTFQATYAIQARPLPA